MTHTSEWNADVFLVEDDDVTEAKVTLHTLNTALTGHGVAHRNPLDPQVPRIGDELATGRAFADLARQLIGTAQEDIDDNEELRRSAPPR
ncbi:MULTISPECIES: DUF1876 domain-containing protein [Streptomycetaceae]|uniref:DUF1876 domain-containing protein n=1 Tax=Streptantibioticus cattleyicolor (strain ATCC 35852 / DSM 46488 / JCM 4925 / NBRC 14057 / NRRL 8057) TaxID=1003195 RepID=F8JT62_STREN|nr:MULTISPECIES: DUF1876 domain-containing protein [Streptomycetaceae]AEW93010.1 hypothetical protein SCATT_06390 [Streptantibioticus cattleyicolor NRRL 8057 = DSM 46488]MYS57746.1 DUF1876 domain-containing protein [Streptomyces sp. SID5468]CCB73370.1 conserved protein of unknown function [Streptantibioticus cattleyicolor NRRL 8057 = DSM 46488]